MLRSGVEDVLKEIIFILAEALFFLKRRKSILSKNENEKEDLKRFQDIASLL